jgi:hypothetical protein
VVRTIPGNLTRCGSGIIYINTFAVVDTHKIKI